MMELHIYGGHVALVDDADYAYVSNFKWHMQGNYIVHSKSMYEHISLHRMLMAAELADTPANTQVDHIDGDKFNNQRSNLRICTPSQNASNWRTPRSKKSTKYRGVHLNRKVWAVYINVNGKSIFGGTFKSDIQAAHRYDELAKLHHGEYAKLNFSAI